MWTYNQLNGNLSHEGELVGTGYSGHPPHVNDPDAENVHNVGPIPTGEWEFGEAVQHPVLGWALPITPAPGTETFGRSGFWCHGDEISHPGERLASDGCMIMALAIRQAINASPDKDLEVV
jgi:hypothetical protein